VCSWFILRISDLCLQFYLKRVPIAGTKKFKKSYTHCDIMYDYTIIVYRPLMIPKQL